ncbi:CA [Globodera pallida]|nr:CA [Globodera pallida]
MPYNVLLRFAFGIFSTFAFTDPLVYGLQSIERDDQAERVLENALGAIRSRVNTAPDDAEGARHRPTPPSSPPRAIFEAELENQTDSKAEGAPDFNDLVNNTSSTLEPITVPISPVRFDLPRPRLNVAATASVVLHPNEHRSERQKFKFVPHFERDFYELMVPEGRNEATKLIATLTFFGRLDRAMPDFDVVQDQLNWFAIGTVTSSQKPNYIVSEVPILLKPGSNVLWSQTENGDYRFSLQGTQGHLKGFTKIRVNVLKDEHEISSMQTEEHELSSTTVTPPLSTVSTLVTMKAERIDEGDKLSKTTVVVQNSSTTISPVTSFTGPSSTVLPLPVVSSSVTVPFEHISEGNGHNSVRMETVSDEAARIILDLDPNLFNINGSSTTVSETSSTAFVDEMVFMLDPTDMELNSSLNNILSASREVRLEQDGDDEEVSKTTMASLVQNHVEEEAEDEAYKNQHNEESEENNNKKMTDKKSGIEVEEKKGGVVTEEKKVLNKAEEKKDEDQTEEKEDEEQTEKKKENEKEAKKNYAEEKKKLDKTEEKADEERGEKKSRAEVEAEETTKKNNGLKYVWKHQNESDVKKYENIMESMDEKKMEEKELLDNYTVKIEFDSQLLDPNVGNVRQIVVPFSSLSSLSQNPIPNLAISIPEILNASLDHDPSLIRLELRPSNSNVLDIHPHHIGPGDMAQLWLTDPETVPDKPMKFELLASVVDWNGHRIDEQTKSIFKGELIVEDSRSGPPLQIHHPEASTGYEFVINENAPDGTEVGRVKLENDIDEHVEFELFGHGSHLFKIEPDGIVRLECGVLTDGEKHNGTRCLDHSLAQAFYLIVTAMHRNGGHRSAPVSVTVRVRDVNDNPPRLRLFSDEIVMVDGNLRGGAPFVIAVSDMDSEPENRFNALSLAGNMSKFFKLHQFDDTDGLLFGIMLKVGVKLMEEGIYELELVVADGLGQRDMKTVPVRVTDNLQPYRFTSAFYSRSMPADRIHTGTPIVRLQLKHSPPSTVVVNYLISDGNPGWLSVEPFVGNVFAANIPKDDGVRPGNYSIKMIAIDREKRQVLAECQLRLELTGQTVAAEQLQFPLPYVSISTDSLDDNDKDCAVDDQLNCGQKSRKMVDLTPFPDGEYLRYAEFDDNLEAWDDADRPTLLPKGALQVFLPGNGTIRLDMTKLRAIRSLHLKFTIKSKNVVDGNASEALVAITFRVDQAKTLARRQRLAKPWFAAPWTSESVPIRLRIAEELPIGHPILQLPAFNQVNSSDRVKISLDQPSAKFFSICNDGVVVVNARLDFEQLSSTEQRLLAFRMIASSSSESSQHNTTAQVQVELLDLDDTAPVVLLLKSMLTEPNRVVEETSNDELLMIELEENSAGEQLELVLLEVHDPDSKTHRCELIGGDGKFATQRQNGEKQWILTANSDELDREVQSHYAFVFRCIDAGGNSGEIPIRLTLLDKNDNRPLIVWDRQDTHIRLLDNMPAGTAIGRFLARDRDEGNNGSVEFVLGQRQPAATEYFRVDRSNGLLYVTDRALVELSAMLGGQPMELEVFARDNGHPAQQSSMLLQILLEDGMSARPRELQMVKPALGDSPLQVAEITSNKFWFKNH